MTKFRGLIDFLTCLHVHVLFIDGLRRIMINVDFC